MTAYINKHFGRSTLKREKNIKTELR